MSTAPCVFCEIVAGRSPAEVVWSDERFVAFLVIHPIVEGHLVVIPREHAASIYDLDPATYSAIFDRARILAGIIRRVYEPNEVGIAVEGLSVRHVHVHVLPVNQPGDLDPSRARTADAATLRAVGERLRKAAGSDAALKRGSIW
jgi:histidine triad (HIT) family protein